MFTSPLWDSRTATTPPLLYPGPTQSPESADSLKDCHDKPDFEVIAAFHSIMKTFIKL